MERINKIKKVKKLFLIPLMLSGSLTVATACSGDEPLANGQEQVTSERDAASLVPEATFEEPSLLTSGTLGNMATRIPQWIESLGAAERRYSH